MAARAQITAALVSPDRCTRTEAMAEVMRRAEASDGACLEAHLTCAGFTAAEVAAYRDDALAVLSGRPMTAHALPAGRLEGITLVHQARAIRARQADGRPSAGPVA